MAAKTKVRSRGRPKGKAGGDGNGEVLFVRVDRATLDALDGLADRLRAATQLPVTRSDVVRRALRAAIEADTPAAPT